MVYETNRVNPGNIKNEYDRKENAAKNLAASCPNSAPLGLEHVTLRQVYLSSLGVIFLVAFMSYYVQFPGLLSSSGLEPVSRVLPYALPNVDKYLVQRRWIDPDSLCELLALGGTALSAVAASGFIHHGLIFALLTIIYYVLVALGGIFYSFQWDVLLLETGAITSLCYCSWTRRNLRPKTPGEYLGSTVGSWPLRFLLFKLMFMSGVVKIQANCPTWLNLTALEYHFATQCLPGPLAWHAHQLHPFLLRLSVAITFLIEIPVAFLLIAPTVATRRIGAWLQIILQVMIIVTGNYNFFNLLTIVLCVPCMERDGPCDLFDDVKASQESKRKRYQLVFSTLEHTACWAFIGWSFHTMFKFKVVESSTSWWDSLNILLNMKKEDCNDMIEWSLPIAIVLVFLFILLFSLVACSQQSQHSHRILIRGLLCAFCVGVISIPMLSLTPNLERTGFAGSEFFSPIWLTARYYRVANGYGLFRRMTGVGRNRQQANFGVDAEKAWGWAGLPPSIVARPEIILEGVFNDTNSSYPEEWRELTFRWKPGDVMKRPQQVAPHQPRLDWQMWFAALGNYQRNPWFIHLIKKILDGCHPVLDLLGDPMLKTGNRRLVKIRAKLWKYDFTRIDTEWSRKIPDVKRLEGRGCPPAVASFLPSGFTSMLTWPDQYWTRTEQREYSPVIESNNLSVSSFLSARGYPDSVCSDGQRRCMELGDAVASRFFCNVATVFRAKNLVWAPAVLLIIYGALWIFVIILQRKTTGIDTESTGCKGI